MNRKRYTQIFFFRLSIFLVVISTAAVLVTFIKDSRETPPPEPAIVQAARIPLSQTPQPSTGALYTLTIEDTQLQLDRYEADALGHRADDSEADEETGQADDGAQDCADEQDTPETAEAKANDPQVSSAVYPATPTSLSTATSLEGVTLTYIGNIYCTGYDPFCRHCGSGIGLTASGVTAEVGRTVAMNGIRFGTELYIEGIGLRLVEDRGPMPGQDIDIACVDHAACYAITGRYKVYLVERETP